MGNGRHGGRASPMLGSDGGPGSGPSGSSGGRQTMAQRAGIEPYDPNSMTRYRQGKEYHTETGRYKGPEDKQGEAHDGGPGSGRPAGGTASATGRERAIGGLGHGLKGYEPYEPGKNDHLFGGKSNRAREREGQPTQDGKGRWGGRASPHGRDVGESYQGETIEGFTPTAGMRGSLTKENDGEGLPAFTPKEGGSLNKEALGEMRNSGNAKPLGDPKHTQSGFNPSKSGGRGAGESGSKPPGEPGVGGKQFTSKGSPGNMVSAKDWRR